MTAIRHAQYWSSYSDRMLFFLGNERVGDGPRFDRPEEPASIDGGRVGGVTNRTLNSDNEQLPRRHAS